ncbi:MAG: glycosyltransferase, partial [Halobacteria archaeon]|nr:glycosyltransferase [Halobacteria archaeon]
MGYTSSLKDSLVEDSYLEKGIEGQRRALGTVPSLRKDNDKGFVLPDAVRDADVVHVHGPFSMGMAGASLATSEDIPLVVNYHTPTDEYVKYITQNDRLEKQLKAINNWWERKYLDKADMVVTPSEQARSWLDEKGVESDKVRVLRNGIDVEFFSPTDPSEFRDEHDLDGLTVGYCGRHGYEKDLTDVIDAAARLEDVDVVLVGDGPAREDLIEYAEEVGADNVVFPGFLERERLPEFYSSLDAFVFPSDSETEGLVALEATACGTPVVAADARGMKNTVKHG